MKLTFLMTLLALGFAGHFAQAHDMKNPACAAIHDACETAGHKGKEAHACMHSVMKGDPVKGVTQDLTASVKDCSTAMKEMHHDHAKAPEQPESN